MSWPCEFWGQPVCSLSGTQISALFFLLVLNLKTYFTFIYLCLCVCRSCVDSIQGEQNGTLDAPELELQEVVKCQLWCEELNFGPLQEQSKLSITEPSLQIFSIENCVFRTEILKKTNCGEVIVSILRNTSLD